MELFNRCVGFCYDSTLSCLTLNVLEAPAYSQCNSAKFQAAMGLVRAETAVLPT